MPGEVDLGIDELSRFTVIGTGGFSTVYAAWDEGFRRWVAVKLLHSLDEAGQRRFAREREIMGQLSSHPNVIMPFRAGYTANGAPFLVMELVEGGSLQDLVDEHGRVPWPDAIDYVLGATTALGYAHDRDILHRDVKPANILLADDVPKLTDFGIAAIRESTASQVAYTLAHCPPEAFASGRDTRDERSDLYSMASTLYCLLGGRPPFDIDEPDSQHAYMFRIIEHSIPELPPDAAPEQLRAFLRAALAKDPDERPQTAAEFMSELARIRSLSSAEPADYSSPRPGWSAAVTNVEQTGEPLPPPDSTPPTEVFDRPGPGAAPASGPGTGPASGPTVSTSPPSPDAWPPPRPRAGAQEIQLGTDRRPGPPGTDGQPGSELPTSSSVEHASAGAPAARRRGLLAALLGVILVVALGAGWWNLARNTDTAATTDTTDAANTATTDAATTDTAATPDTADTATTATTTDVDVGPEVAWTFETGSSLASRPSVADGVLVIGAHVTNTVYAVDTATGLEAWTFETGGSVDANPLIVDGVVYIGSFDGSMYALDLDDGMVIWQQDIGAGIGGGALATDELLVFGNDDGAVTALDIADGTPRWSFSTEGRINSTPVTAGLEDREVIVVGSTDGGLYLLDPSTGDQIERIGLQGGVWFSIPLVVDRPNGSGQEVWVGTSAQDEGFLNRVDLDRMEVATFGTSAGVGTSPVLTDDGFVIAGNDLGELFAVDRVSLGERWREGYADETQIKGSPVLVGDQVVFGTHGKELISVIAADGSEVWRFEGEQIFGLSSPVVVGDQLYVGNDSGTVYRFDL